MQELLALTVAAAQVLKFNGVDVRNVFQLAELIETCTDEFWVLDLDYDEILVLDTAQAKASTEEILRVHNIPRQMSHSVETYLTGRKTSTNGAAPDALAAADSSPASRPDNLV